MNTIYFFHYNYFKCFRKKNEVNYKHSMKLNQFSLMKSLQFETYKHPVSHQNKKKKTERKKKERKEKNTFSFKATKELSLTR